jgi:hypothetical protein
MSIQQVEIVKPSRPIPQALGELFASLVGMGIRVLIVWWALAVWFPELGITYWQAILPFYAARALVAPKPQFRQLTGK